MHSIDPKITSRKASGNSAAKTLLPFDYGVVLILLCFLWTGGVFWFQARINSLGACATTSCAKSMAVLSKQFHDRPESLRLGDSYETWRRNLIGLDMAGYIEAGIEFAHGRGLSVRTGSDGATLVPYTYHPPLTPMIIGFVIKLFGDKSVYPYFLFMCFAQLASSAITVILAGNFVQTRTALFTAGLLSLFCWPALEYTFGAGLFSSEAVTYPFFGISLLALAAYRKRAAKDRAVKSDEKDRSLVAAVRAHLPYALIGIVFGVFSAVCAYARDAFGAFATISMALTFIKDAVNRKLLLKALTFAVIAFVVMHALESPWEKYMQRITGHKMMSIVGWNGFVFWNWSIWPDAQILKVSDDDSCAGVGTFIAPKMQPLVAQAFAADPSTAGLFAAKAYIQSFLKHPIEAISFRLRYYDCLWFGHRWETLIYAFSLVSALFFAAFVYLQGRRFYHELYIYPIYMLMLSALIHYDHRFCYAFYVFITPVCVAAVIETLILRRRASLLLSAGAQAEAGQSANKYLSASGARH